MKGIGTMVPSSLRGHLLRGIFESIDASPALFGIENLRPLLVQRVVESLEEEGEALEHLVDRPELVAYRIRRLDPELIIV